MTTATWERADTRQQQAYEDRMTIVRAIMNDIEYSDVGTDHDRAMRRREAQKLSQFACTAEMKFLDRAIKFIQKKHRAMGACHESNIQS